MKRFVSRALYATLFTGGLVLLGAGAAHASETTGEEGILSGTQLGISVEAPITVSGNAVSVIGDSESSDATTEVSTGEPGAGGSEPVAVTSGEDGIGSGSQAVVDVSGRPYCVHTGEPEGQQYVQLGGTTPAFLGSLTRHVFETIAFHAHLALHVRVLAGREPHHIVETQFKAFARAFRDAIALDPRETGIPSTKGAL